MRRFRSSPTLWGSFLLGGLAIAGLAVAYCLRVYTATSNDYAVLACCGLGLAYVFYKAYDIWRHPVIIDQEALSLRRKRLCFSDIIRFTKQEPIIITTPGGRVLYRDSYWYTIETESDSLTLISGMFPEHEEIAREIVERSGVPMELLDKYGDPLSKDG